MKRREEGDIHEPEIYPLEGVLEEELEEENPNKGKKDK